jgi:large subunit ribosomal protein L9
MEIILLEPVKKLGRMGDKVEVKNGYARNYLIPRGIALRASGDNLKVFESRRAEIEKQNSEKQQGAEKLAKKLKDLEVTIIRQAAEDGRLFGSVTVREIAEQIKEKGFEIDSKSIDLLNPIRAVGVSKVRVSLHAEVNVEVTVNVARSETEAENQLSDDKAPPKAAVKESAKEPAEEDASKPAKKKAAKKEAKAS